MMSGINNNLVELFAAFHEHNIQEGTFILTLRTLLYPDTISCFQDDDPRKDRINFCNTFFSNVRQFDPPVIYSALGLAQYFQGGKHDSFKQVYQEIEEKKDLLMPGIVQHIGMGMLFGQLIEPKGLEPNEYAGAILRMAIIDLLQNPLSENMLRDYHNVLINLAKTYNLNDKSNPGWKFIDDTLGHLSCSQFEALKDAFHNLVTYKRQFASAHSYSDWDKITESYLRTHPQSVNKIVVDAFNKNYALAEKFQAIPLLWYIAFLDQWLHDKKHFPKHLPMTIKWLDEYRKSYFNYFCGKNKERKAFLKLFLLYGFPQYLLSYPSRIIKTKNGETTYFKPMRAYERLVNQEPLDHKTLVYLLESIDQERFSFLLRDSDCNSHLYSSIFGDKSRQDINNFSELHAFIEERFQSISARRTAYLLFLMENNRINIEKDLSDYTNLMKNRFYADKYKLTLRDILLILTNFAGRNVEEVFIKSVKGKIEIGNEIALFVHTFFDLLQESLSAISADDEYLRKYLLWWAYEKFAQPDNELSDMTKSKLSLLGFNVPFFDKYGITAFSMPHPSEISNTNIDSKEAKNLNSSLYLNDLWELSDYEIHELDKHISPQSKELINIVVKGWMRFSNQELVVLGYVPFVYHPIYGYGVIYSTEYTSISKAPHYSQASLAILFYDNIDTQSVLLKPNIEIVFRCCYDLPILSPGSNAALRKAKKSLMLRLEQTPLKGASVEFVEVKGFKHRKSMFVIERKALLSMHKPSPDINSSIAFI